MATYKKIFIASAIIMILGFVGMVVCNMTGVYTVSKHIITVASVIAIVLIIIGFCNYIYTKKKNNEKIPIWIIIVLVIVIVVIGANIINSTSNSRIQDQVRQELTTNNK